MGLESLVFKLLLLLISVGFSKEDLALELCFLQVSLMVFDAFIGRMEYSSSH